MPVPSTIYLRDKNGGALGPLPLHALEVLYDARIVDEGTPVSTDGAAFHPLREIGDVLGRLKEVKELLVNGGDPWAAHRNEARAVVKNTAPAPAPNATVSAPPPKVSTPPPPRPSAPAPEPLDDETSPLQGMFEAATGKKTGKLDIKNDGQYMVLSYRDGKIVNVETNIDKYTLGTYLVDNNVCDQSAVKTGTARAPMMGPAVNEAS